MNQHPLPEPRRVAIAPIDCIQGAGRLIAGDYGVFLGITLVGVLIAAMVPFGLLAAPMYAGIFMAFRNKELGRPVAFDTLFSRFDTFVQGLIATLVYFAVIVAVSLPVYFVAMAGVIGGGAAMEENNEGLGIVLFCLAGLAYLLAFAFAIVAQVAFTFTYALITEHSIDGLAALRLSFRAARMNFWGVLGLVLLVALISLVSMALCFLPLLFVLPYLTGATWVAYRKVFGGKEPDAVLGGTAGGVPGQSWANDG
jgi:hypothetical protein